MPEKKRIALFSSTFLAYSQTFIYDELLAHSKNYEITVFCKNRTNADKFPFDNFHSPKGKINVFLYENLGFWPPFNRIFKENKFDLIHAHFGTSAVYARHYAQKFNIPLIITFHGNDVASALNQTRLFPKQLRYTLIIKKLINEMALGLVVSKELIELLKDLGADENKIRHFRLGIDTNKFTSITVKDTQLISFIMIGRFTEKKGHIYALRAFRKVIEKGYKATLTLVGSGETMKICEEYVKMNRLENHVKFTGILSSSEVAERLKNSHVMLAPSVVAANFDREGLPTVLKEAMASEIPVISTYHAGIPELISDEIDGFLVTERSVDSLAERMIRFIVEPNLIKEFGKKGRQKILELYDIKKEIISLEKYYDEVISSYL